MEFPTSNYKFNGLEEGPTLAEQMDQKLASLSKFLPEQGDITCDVEFEKVAPQQQGPVHRVEINLMLDGTLFRAESTKETFTEAIDEVRDELAKELRRTKGKQVTQDIDAARAAKEQLRDVV